MKKECNHLPMYGIGPLCVYSMILFTLVPIVLYHLGYLEAGQLEHVRIPFRIIAFVLLCAGIFMWCKAVLHEKIDRNIRQNCLKTDGIYGCVRNPIYSAVAVALTGVCFYYCNLWFFILPFIYWIDITFLMRCTEEKWLRDLYGEEYESYCRRVNRCIPWFPKKSSRRG